MLCHAGSHLSSTVHLHGYLGMLMFQDDIYGHIQQPTHTRTAYSEHTRMYPLTTEAGGHTWWGSHQREATCTLDEISCILKGNSNHVAFVKSAQRFETTSDAIGNWCCVQGNSLRGKTTLKWRISCSWQNVERMFANFCVVQFLRINSMSPKPLYNKTIWFFFSLCCLLSKLS